MHLTALFPDMPDGTASRLVRGVHDFPKYLRPFVLDLIVKARDSGLFAKVDLEQPPRAPVARGSNRYLERRKAAVEERRKAKKLRKA